MHLKREQKFWLAADEGGPWLPLEAGVFQMKSTWEGGKKRWFSMGSERDLKEEQEYRVRILILQFHFHENDAAQKMLLNSDGRFLWLKENNVGFAEKISACTVELHGEENGTPADLQQYRVSLRICG